ncbi:hypothetical protein E3P92_00715 [Wallemia ichthyophaga]|uniref:JmjC domain-containing protein n=1 Tax=Wallemia ichthyophaga TaxID=245174 RepID=A0A4T0HGF5_WALIC|nr:hypothetical protein E3P98_00695 [Wallemia ichthyophaga]TIA93849.1 hypothetical protein E3P97_00620 [Wallemia ichthyophaga]TIA98140.1 hypothetical protein E3P96_03227 [Wallemia ichthyophaga]TIB03064.1 hypothetical protein E3P95_00669 [Wallemia ichthyophaga]TIB03980.1 hypothetical protein E3P94_00801 [Wallemia ichthyophaga]
MKLNSLPVKSADEFFKCIPFNSCFVSGLFTQPWLNISRAIEADFDILTRDEHTANITVPIEIQQPGFPLSADSRHEIPLSELVPYQYPKYLNEITLDLFIKLFIQNQQQLKPKIGYLAQFDLIAASPYLQRMFPMIPELHRLKPKSSSWLGPQSTLTPIHRDATTEGNLLLQVTGSKRVNVIDPIYADKLNLHPDNSPMRNFSRFLDELPNAHLPIQVESGVLNPGDAVYIPPGYYHSFKSLSDSFSVNFWFQKSSSRPSSPFSERRRTVHQHNVHNVHRIISPTLRQFEFARKSERDLKKMPKKIKSFYQKQNEILDAYASVDDLLESSYPHDVLARLRGIAAGDEQTPLLHFPSEQNEKNHNKTVNVVLNVNLIINILLLGAKGAAVLLSDSVSLFASLVESVLDLLSSLIIYGTTLCAGHRDDSTRFKYPVGKQRFEPLGVIIFSVFMIGSFLQVLFESISRLQHIPITTLLPLAGILSMVITVIVKAFIWVFCFKIKSSGVQAIAQDSLNDVVFNIISLSFPYMGQVLNIPQLDPIGGIILSLYIIIEWTGTLIDNFSRLSGRVADPVELSKVLYCVTRFTPVQSVSYIECYHVGDNVIVEVDVVLPPSVSLPVAHDWGETIQYVIESLEGIERGFVHLDYNPTNPPGHKMQASMAVEREKKKRFQRQNSSESVPQHFDQEGLARVNEIV